ncbi:MAG: SEC-C metal-binding domain-containing protein [Planctomycetia bacterium]|nr:SEC-C metal-binding domain-containing protein [Planctomycetia bacterium]
MEILERIWELICDFFTGISRAVEKTVTSFFGSSNARFIKTLQPRVEAINALEPKYKAMSMEELRQQTELFKKRLHSGETLDDILNEAFAVCREASSRVLGLRHYDVQLIGGIVLHTGAIAEMMTGEGKTLVATLPAYLNALEGKGVHVVTVNDYLARRDMEWMGPLYMALGLTVGAIQSNMSTADRQHAYSCDITYGTNNEFGFDYLRDNMRSARRGDERFSSESQQSQGRLHYAIVDEVDNILIDEARTPLIIAGPSSDDVTRYKVADDIARQLTKDVDFKVDEKDHTTNLTDEGVRRAEKLAGVESFYTLGNMHWPHLIDNSLKAHHLYKRDVNYVIKNGEIVIVDEFTGRLMEGRSWSDGLHQAVEAKEGVKVKEENQTLATITLQNFFKLYDKLGGMTGTAMTEASEFWKIYNLDVIAIPPNRPVIRVSHPDLIYKSEKEKYKAVVDEIERVHRWDIVKKVKSDAELLGTISKEDDNQIEFIPKGEKGSVVIKKSEIESIQHHGAPILVGTVTIQKSELISNMLDRRGIKHQVLNARPENIGRESEIVAQAGRFGAITIATNMAGRGTDIILGGNPETLAWAYFQTKYPTRLDVPQEEWSKMVQDIENREKMKSEGDFVRTLGGLHIIGTERHEARRIDLQLRGRCGRQGDPGDSRFFLSLEDDLVRIFAGDWVKNILTRLGMEEGQAIESRMVTRRIEGAQKKIEERNFDIRKSLLEYDEVMDMQRKRVYSYRQRILDGGNTKDFIQNMIDHQLEQHLKHFLDRNFGAERYAEWVTQMLSIEFEMKQFRGMDAKSAQEYALDHARRMSETKALDAVEENLSLDVPQDEWNWNALAKTTNFLWKTTLRGHDLQKVGRDNIAEFLIDKANKFLDTVDLSQGGPLLEPNYGVNTACAWLKTHFTLDIDPDTLKDLDSEKFFETVREKVLEKYREKEVRFPVMALLQQCTIHDQLGKRYDRERAVELARNRFGCDISVDELKNKQRHEIEEALFKISNEYSSKADWYYDEMDAKLDDIFDSEKIEIAKIRKLRDYKIARNDRITVDDLVKVNRNDPKVAELCEWQDAEFGYKITPREMADWDCLLIRDRLESVIEDRFNPEMRRVERYLILGILDAAWKEHLLVMDRLKSSVSFHGYAQMDPKVEYKRLGMQAFEQMWDSIYERVSDYVFRVEQLDENFISSTWVETEARHESLPSNEIREQQDAAIEASQSHKVETIRNRSARVGRNDPCPCGSGKKFKNCCGKGR